MRVAICDDMKSDRSSLISALRQLEQDESIEIDIEEYGNPNDLFVAYETGKTPQVIFFDVYMGDELGTKAALRMRELGYDGSIIFCTTSEDHALEGFKVHADGYLVKPYSYEQFKDSLIRLRTLIKSEHRKVKFVSERIEYDTPIYEIYMVETSGKGCNVHTSTEVLFTWKKLKEFVEELNYESFYQIGRSVIINLNAIDKINNDHVVMKDKTQVFFPVREMHKVKQDINDFVWKKMRN